MTDWIEEANKAIGQMPIDWEDLTLRDFNKWFELSWNALPRALKALRAADELAQALEDWKKGKEPAFIVDEALAAYRKARS